MGKKYTLDEINSAIEAKKEKNKSKPKYTLDEINSAIDKKRKELQPAEETHYKYVPSPKPSFAERAVSKLEQDKYIHDNAPLPGMDGYEEYYASMVKNDMGVGAGMGYMSGVNAKPAKNSFIEREKQRVKDSLGKLVSFQLEGEDKTRQCNYGSFLATFYPDKLREYAPEVAGNYKAIRIVAPEHKTKTDQLEKFDKERHPARIPKTKAELKKEQMNVQGQKTVTDPAVNLSLMETSLEQAKSNMEDAKGKMYWYLSGTEERKQAEATYNALKNEYDRQKALYDEMKIGIAENEAISTETYVNSLLNADVADINAQISEFEKKSKLTSEEEKDLFYLRGLNSYLSLNENERKTVLRYTGIFNDEGAGAREDMQGIYDIIVKIGGNDNYGRMVDTLRAFENMVDSSKSNVNNMKFALEHPILANIVSVPASAIGGAVGVLDIAGTVIDDIGKDEQYKTPIDVNIPSLSMVSAVNTIRSTTAAEIERSVGDTGGKVAAFLYQTGMSGIDSVTAMAVGGAGAAALNWSRGATNAFLDAKERGTSDAQATLGGILAGTAESIFERFSIGNFKSLKEVPAATIADVFKNIAKSVGVNASEEMATEAANIISDFCVNLDYSAAAQIYNTYSEQDKESGKALKETLGTMFGQVLLAGAGGAVMGAGMSGPISAIGYASNYSYNEAAGLRYMTADGKIDNAAALKLISKGKASNNEFIKAYAETLEKRSDKLDIKEVGQLSRMLGAQSRADYNAKKVKLPEGMKPGDTVTVMEDDGSLRVMLAEDAAAAGKFEPKGTQKTETDASLHNGEKTPTSENLTVRGVSGDLEAMVKKTVDNVNVASAMPDNAEARVYSALSGTVNNAVADSIANTPELSAAFEKMSGVKLEGSLSQKRKAIKQNAAALVEKFRIKNAESVTSAVKRAEFGNDSELMLGAVGDFGGAIYRTIVDKGVRAAAIKGVLAHQQFNADFGEYYNAGYKGLGFAYNDRILSEADARAVYNAAVRDAALANATSVTERSGIIAGATKEKIALVERLSKALKRDILFVNMPVVNGETFNGCYSEDGKIYVNVNTKDAIVKVVAHEFTHSLESRGLYGTFLKFVFDTLAKEGKTKAQLLKDKRNSASVYKHKSDTELEHEIVAQFVEERLLTDEKVMRDIVREKGKPFAQKLHDILNTLIEKTKAAFGRNADGWTLKQLNAIEKGRKLLAEVIKSEDVGDSRDSIIFSLSPTKVSRLKEIINSLGQKGIKLLAGNKQIKVLTDDFTVNKAIFSQKGRTSREVNARIKAIPDFENILRHSRYVGADTDIRNIENAAKKGVISMLHFEAQYGDYTLDILFRDKGTKQYLYEIKFIDNKKSSQQSMADKTASTAPKGDVENKNSVTHDAKEVNSELKFSFAGKHAKTANIATLNEAKYMEAIEGADGETIRKATGWHKGYDGKWRFEIDDSKMILFKRGDALFSQMHPEYAELQNLYQKMFDLSITDAEYERLIRIEKAWGRERARLAGRVDRGGATLQDIIQHDVLFKAYPQLRNVKIVFEGMDSGTNGSYNRTTKTIKLGEHLLKNEFKLKKTLLHEIQHAVQHIEGFAEGSNPESWELKKKNDLDESKKAHDDTLGKILSLDNGNYLDKWREYNRGEIELSELLAEESYTQKEKELFLKHIQNSQRYLALRNDSRSGELLYEKTAGEIEARDASARADLVAEQRKNTRPDIDRTDVVFAGGGEVLYVSAENNEGSSIREQIRANLDSLNAMQPVVNIDYASIAKKDLRSVVEEEFKKIGYHVDRQNFGLIEISEGEIKKSLNYLFTDGEKAALLAVPRVLKRGIEIERRSKHKGQSYGTVTIAAPITINGTQIGIVGAVVKMTGKNRYRTHRILMPDGSEFVFNDNKNDAEFTFSDMRTKNGTQRPDINSASTNSISNPDENVKENADIRFSVSSSGDGEGGDSDVSLMPNGEAEPSYSDIDMAPVVSAEKMLSGGMKFSEVVKKTGISLREIALDMESRGESAEDIRELTGLYRDNVGGWQFDSKWLEKNSGDLASSREAAYAAAKSAFNITDAGITPGELEQARITLEKTHEGARKLLKPTAAEHKGEFARSAAEWAVEMAMKDKVPTVDATLRSGATLLDMAKKMRGKYSDSTIRRVTGYAYEGGEWVLDQKAMRDIIKAGGKDLTVDDYLVFEAENSQALADEQYNKLYKPRKPYALKNLGIKIAKPLVDVIKSGDKPSQLRMNEKEIYNLKKYINSTFEHIAKPSGAERNDAKAIVSGIKSFNQLSEGSRRDVVLQLIELEIALRGLKDSGVEMQHFLNKQRFKEEITLAIFGDDSAELPTKAVKQWILTLNTSLRNSLDAFGDKVGKKVNDIFFKPVGKNETNRIRFVNEQAKKIAELKLNNYESAAVQMKAEDTDASREALDKLLKEHSKKIDMDKVSSAVPVFHELYNTYYDAINDFLVMHGYKPIGFVKNYMPHVQKDSVISDLKMQLDALGFETEKVTELPAEIAGRTEQFKPGKKWTPYFLQRKSERGGNVQYDAVGCFDSYVNYISEVLYHTDDIQKLRIFNQVLREQYSDAKMSEKIADLKEKLYSPDPDRNIAELESELEAAYGELEKSSLYGTYATWLDEYTDNLAGKQSKFDRIFEAKLGRRVLNFGKTISNTFGAATIVGNISSWFNQLVQLPLVAAESGGVLNHHMARAFWDITFGGNSLNKTLDFDKASDFYTGKKGIKYAAKEKFRIVDACGKPFEWFDNFSTKLMLRTKYYQLISENKALTPEAAIEQANEYVEKVVGSRLKGAKPIAFTDKNIISKMITMFQLENTNGWAHILKDVPREFKQYIKVHGAGEAAKKLIGFIIGALLNTFIFNRLAQEIWGQTPAPYDAVGVFVDGMGAGYNITGNHLLRRLTDKVSENLLGVSLFNTDELGEFSLSSAVGEGAEQVIDDIPLVGNVSAMLGLTDGRLPIPKIWDSDISNGAKALSGDDKAAAVKQMLGGIGDVAKTWIPMGSQISKTVKGAKLAFEHDMRTSGGNVMFASDMGLWDTIKACMFGPSALEEYNEYWLGGRYLSNKETSVYDKMAESGAGYEASFDALNSLYDAKADANAANVPEKPYVFKRIDESPISDETKEIMYYNYIATKAEKELITKLEVDLDVEHGEIYRLMSAMYKAQVDDYPELADAEADAIEERKAKCIEEGEEFTEKMSESIHNSFVEKAKIEVLDSFDISKNAKAAVYCELFASESESEIFEEIVGGGASEGDVYELLLGFSKSDSAASRADVIAGTDLEYSEKEIIFYDSISDAWYDEVEALKSVGGNIDMFAAAYSATRGVVGDKDKEGKTIYLSKSKKLKAAIDDAVPGASKKEKEALYEALGVSKKVW